MYIEKQFSFEASHILPKHPGKCSRLHGHSYKLVVGLEGQVNKEDGFVLDFADLKLIVKPIVDMLDHRHLNAFIRYPSAENISLHIANLLRAKIQFQQFDRMVVKISETGDTWAIWDSLRREDVMTLREDPLQAQWGSPDSGVPLPRTLDHLDEEVASLSEDAEAAFEVFEKIHTKFEQVRLYREGLHTVDRL